MIERGKVIRIDDEYVYVELKHNDFCSKCWRCSEEIDFDDILLDDDEINEEEIKVRQVLRLKKDYNFDIKINDIVEIEVSNNIFYVNLLLEYIVPILDFIIGFLIAYYISFYIDYAVPETNGLILGTIFFTISYWLSKVFSSEIMISWNLYPKITAILKRNELFHQINNNLIC